jgi:cell division initiation protein
MIDLTPLDVRKKRGDFRKGMRGYDPSEVDSFLELVAERLEVLVRENLALRERCDALEERVSTQEGRERAVQEALVTAQSLREEIQEQARREADLLRREAEEEGRRIREEVLAEARTAEGEILREAERRRQEVRELERVRARFFQAYRGLLERELDALGVREEQSPVPDVDLDEVTRGRYGRGASAPASPPPESGAGPAQSVADASGPAGGAPDPIGGSPEIPAAEAEPDRDAGSAMGT